MRGNRSRGLVAALATGLGALLLAARLRSGQDGKAMPQ